MFAAMGCLTFQSAVSCLSPCDCSFFLPSSFTLAAVASPHCPWFPPRYRSMRWWGAVKATTTPPPPPPPSPRPDPNTCTRIDNALETWWDFRAKWQVGITLGGGRLLSQYLTDVLLQFLHSVGGNKAQCHGNHIKSTLKTDLLKKKAMTFLLIFTLFCSVYVLTIPCQFPWNILLWGKKYNQVSAVGLWFIGEWGKSHVWSNTFCTFTFMTCFQCRWLYLFYTVHTCNNVLCTPTQPRASCPLSARCHLKGRLVLMALPSMLDAHGRSPHVATPGWAVPFIAAPCDIAVSLSGGAGNFSMTSTGQNNITSEASVWDECHKCNINCHIAVHACVLSPPPSQPWISTDTQLLLWRNGLLARSHKDSEHMRHPSTLTPSHVLLNYSNGANPMHFSLCNMYSCLSVMQQCHLSCKPRNCPPVLVLLPDPVSYVHFFKFFWVSEASGSPCHIDVISPSRTTQWTSQPLIFTVRLFVRFYCSVGTLT